VVEISGEADVDSVEASDAARADALARGQPIILDLQRCEFMDSTGAAGVIWTFQEAKSRFVPFAIVGPSPPVAKVLRQIGVFELLPTFERLEDALEQLGPSKGDGDFRGSPTL
jgi:anti-anti-sigma factor